MPNWVTFRSASRGVIEKFNQRVQSDVIIARELPLKPEVATRLQPWATQIATLASVPQADILLEPMREAAKPILSLLESVPTEEVPMTVAPFASRDEDTMDSRLAAAALVSGLLAMTEAARGDDDKDLSRLVNLAFGADALSLNARLNITGLPDKFDPKDPLGGLGGKFALPKKLQPCLGEIRSAMARFGAALQAARHAAAITATADADGVQAVTPQDVGPGDIVTLIGQFPAKQPAGTSVVVSNPDRVPIPCIVETWSGSQIEVQLPCGVSDGPIGFLRLNDPGALDAIDPTAGAALSDTLVGCLGPGARGPAGIVARHPALLGPPTLPWPLPGVLPGSVNLLTAGPFLQSLSVATTKETDPPTWVEVSGHGFRKGDEVVVHNSRCPTVFVDPTRLRFTLHRVASGPNPVVVERRGCSSRPLQIEVEPVFDQITTKRVKPGSVIEVKATGFAEGRFTALLGGVPVPVTVVDTMTAHVPARRTAPPQFTANPDGEVAKLEMFYLGRPFGDEAVTFDTIRILAFGDSVMWGQGLLYADKYSRLSADALLGYSMGCYDAMHAHSGATIMSSPAEPPARAPDDPYPSGSTLGENPSTAPSITMQVAAWDQPAWRGQASRVKFVLLDGGINDVGVNNILDPFGSDAALESQTRQACEQGMSQLLSRILGVFPRAKVIVTGYYPLVSQDSDLVKLYLMLGALGLVPVISGITTPLATATVAILEAYRQRVIARSNIFLAASDASLAAAVAAQNDPRAVFVPTGFRSENAVYGPHSYLWELTIPWLNAQDPMAAARHAICQGSFRCNIASLGHPNVAGAKVIAYAVRPHLAL